MKMTDEEKAQIKKYVVMFKDGEMDVMFEYEVLTLLPDRIDSIYELGRKVEMKVTLV